jgi:small subunit ribosomal protein S4e
MKRFNAQRTLRIHRKEKIWTVKPSPGPHPIEKSIPLGLIIRDYLKLTDTMKETKRVLSNNEIIVDGKIRKEYKYPVGLMDVISVPELKKDFRVMFDQKGKLTLIPTSSKDAKWKLCRIENKTIIKGNKTQINLHDGQNKIVKKDDYKTGDVLKIEFKDRKITDKYEFKKGNVSIIVGGSHIGEVANIQDLETISSSKPNLAKMKGKTDFLTLQEYVFPIGKTSPAIEIPEVKIK